MGFDYGVVSQPLVACSLNTREDFFTNPVFVGVSGGCLAPGGSGGRLFSWRSPKLLPKQGSFFQNEERF